MLLNNQADMFRVKGRIYPQMSLYANSTEMVIHREQHAGSGLSSFVCDSYEGAVHGPHAHGL